MSKKPNRTSRLEVRIAPDALAIVKRAAEIQGRSVSDFVVTAAREAARRTIEETHLTRLTIEEQAKFADLLLNPPEPSPALKRARKVHRQLVRESR
jgi:uncharacterized protein (DUF1778 family)